MSRRYPGWARLSEPGRKLRALWNHEASGWRVAHCGHPTANWPYHGVDPDDPDRCVVTHNGLGFRTLLDAFEAIEGALAGHYLVTNDSCGPTTRRIVRPTDPDCARFFALGRGQGGAR